MLWVVVLICCGFHYVVAFIMLWLSLRYGFCYVCGFNFSIMSGIYWVVKARIFNDFSSTVGPSNARNGWFLGENQKQ
jgi:hypothetical protein